MKRTQKAKPETATARVVVLMTPTEKAELFERAAAAGFDSVSAYLRQALSLSSAQPADDLRKRIEILEQQVGISTREGGHGR